MTRHDAAASPSSARPHEPPVRLPADRDTAGPLPAAVGAEAPRASLALVAGFGTLVACLVVLGSIAERLRGGELFVMDQVATPLLHSYASPGLDAVMNQFTMLGSTAAIVPLFALAVVLLAVRHRPGSALFLGVSGGGSLLLNEVMKLFFHRPRPSVPWAHVLPDYSFPSGHTMNSLAFYLALAVIVWSARGRSVGRLAVVGAILLDLCIAVSRVYLGYHYVTDVLGGFLAGLAWVLVAVAAFRWRAVGPFRAPRQGQQENNSAGGGAAGP